MYSYSKTKLSVLQAIIYSISVCPRGPPPGGMTGKIGQTQLSESAITPNAPEFAELLLTQIHWILARISGA